MDLRGLPTDLLAWSGKFGFRFRLEWAWGATRIGAKVEGSLTHANPMAPLKAPRLFPRAYKP